MQLLNLPLYKIVVPTPFHVGPVNVYLITEPEVSLIDAGPHTPEAYAAVRQGLGERSLSLRDVRKILITHGHPDHYGQAAVLARETDAILHAPTFDSPDFQHRINQDFYLRMYEEAGVPPQVVNQFVEEFHFIQQVAEPLTEYTPIQEGDPLLCGDLEFEVLSTPGHTPGSVCFYSRERRLLIAADTVIKRITPNPVLNEDPLRPGKRYPSLKNYLASLEKLRLLGPELVCSGHGDDVDEFPPLFAKMMRHHEERQGRVLALLQGQPKPLWTLVSELFPGVRDDGRFLALSEVFAHVDFLDDRSLVRWIQRDGMRMIEAVKT
ncbi:MAG: MBL fold metallo-hydrolase [Acidobacteriia bacterium]|nr:MBL fold metallo-hydrolase [Terriglobia bacterium]